MTDNTENIDDWIPRIYNKEKINDMKTLFGQLQRIATNRAVYLSIIKMTQENKIQINGLIGNFISDGYNANLVISIRRLVESNKNNHKKEKKVNSILALVEALNEEILINNVAEISQSIGDAPNKIYGHNDLMHHDGEKELNLAAYNTFDSAITELFSILRQASLALDIELPEKLVATNQFDWAIPFDRAWRDNNFDDSDIWDEL